MRVYVCVRILLHLGFHELAFMVPKHYVETRVHIILDKGMLLNKSGGHNHNHFPICETPDLKFWSISGGHNELPICEISDYIIPDLQALKHEQRYIA